MNSGQLSAVIGLAALMVGLITQASRAIFKTGKIMEMLEAMQKDIVDVRDNQKVLDQRVWDAVRNTPRR